MILTLVALGGILLAIQLVSSFFDERNERTQEQRTLNDGSASARDHLKEF